MGNHKKNSKTSSNLYRYYNITAKELNVWSNAYCQGNQKEYKYILSPKSLKYINIKKHIMRRWVETHGGVEIFVSSKQRAFFSLISSYADVVHPLTTYPTSINSLDEFTDV